MTEILRYVSIAIILLCIPGILWALWDRKRRSRGMKNERHTAHGSGIGSPHTPDDSQMVNPSP